MQASFCVVCSIAEQGSPFVGLASGPHRMKQNEAEGQHAPQKAHPRTGPKYADWTPRSTQYNRNTDARRHPPPQEGTHLPVMLSSKLVALGCGVPETISRLLRLQLLNQFPCSVPTSTVRLRPQRDEGGALRDSRDWWAAHQVWYPLKLVGERWVPRDGDIPIRPLFCLQRILARQGLCWTHRGGASLYNGRYSERASVHRTLPPAPDQHALSTQGLSALHDVPAPLKKDPVSYL